MAETNLTQGEADALIALEKHSAEKKMLLYPSTGGSLHVPLVSANKRESFILDVSRMRINLLKGTYQARARQVVVLVRLDFGGAPHRNPDGIEIAAPHIHLYREGYADKWAFPVSVEEFPNMQDLYQTLHDFYTYCNITQPPQIEKGLFG